MEENNELLTNSLQEDTAEVKDIKELNTYLHTRKSNKFKFSTAGSVICIVTGLILMLGVIGIVLYRTSVKNDLIMYDFSFDATLLYIPYFVNLVAGILLFVVGLISKKKTNKKSNFDKKKYHKEIAVVNKDDYRFQLNNEAEVPAVFVDGQTVLMSKDDLKQVKLVSPLADLEDEDEVLGASQVKVVRNYDFFDLTTKTILDKFIGYGRSNKLEFNYKDSLNLITHMMYSRLMLVKGVNGYTSTSLMRTIQSTFNASCYQISARNFTNESQLVTNKSFEAALAEADKDDDKFVCLFIDQIISKNIKSVIKDFLFAFIDKNNRHKVRTEYSDTQYQVTPNLYIFFILGETNRGAGLYGDNELLKYASLIELGSTEYTGDVPSLVTKDVSVSDYRHVLELSKNNGLDETVWKKIDALQDFVFGLKPGFKIDNDVINGIENYVALTMNINDDVDEIVDNILVSNILPNIFTYLTREQIFGEENTLEQYFQDAFYSDYSLPKTDALFNAYQELLNNPTIETGTGESINLDEFSHLASFAGDETSGEAKPAEETTEEVKTEGESPVENAQQAPTEATAETPAIEEAAPSETPVTEENTTETLSSEEASVSNDNVEATEEVKSEETPVEETAPESTLDAQAEETTPVDAPVTEEAPTEEIPVEETKEEQPAESTEEVSQEQTTTEEVKEDTPSEENK